MAASAKAKKSKVNNHSTSTGQDLLAKAMSRQPARHKSNLLTILRENRSPEAKAVVKVIDAFIRGELSQNFRSVAEFHRWLSSEAPQFNFGNGNFFVDLIRREQIEHEKAKNETGES